MGSPYRTAAIVPAEPPEPLLLRVRRAVRSAVGRAFWFVAREALGIIADRSHMGFY